MYFDNFYRYNGGSFYVDKWHVQEYQLHIHSDIELQLILEGSVECHVAQRIYSLKQGDILLTNRKQPHALVQPSPNCMAIWLAINPSFCSPYYPELSITRFQDVFFGKDHPLNHELQQLIITIYDCFLEKRAYYAFTLLEILNRIVRLLLINSRHNLLSEAEVTHERQNGQRIAQIIDFIERNYAMQPRLEELARRMELSADYLSHFIKETLGVTYREYLTRIRLRHALELMCSDKFTQLDILLQTGFSDYRYFKNAFKRNYGYTPEAYIAMLRQKS